MTKYQVWAEGYRATGESGTATFLGEAEGDTFEEACKRLAVERDDPKFFHFGMNRPPAYWGCRLFDNEAAARENFG